MGGAYSSEGTMGLVEWTSIASSSKREEPREGGFTGSGAHPTSGACAMGGVRTTGGIDVGSPKVMTAANARKTGSQGIGHSEGTRVPSDPDVPDAFDRDDDRRLARIALELGAQRRDRDIDRARRVVG